MHATDRPATKGRAFRFALGFTVLAAIAGFLLFTEHRAHVLGALPFAILLLCPLLHFFMHGGHEEGHGAEHQEGRP